MERPWLIRYREIKSLTQEQVADLCEIKRAYYTMIETGKRRPSVEVAKKIAEALGFEWTFFFAPIGSVPLPLGKDLENKKATSNVPKIKNTG